MQYSLLKLKWTQLIHSTPTRSITPSGMAMVPMCSKTANLQGTPNSKMLLPTWMGYTITLTLWVTNPVSLIAQCLACMDCESKNKENVALFLKLSNEILCKVKKDPTFI